MWSFLRSSLTCVLLVLFVGSVYGQENPPAATEEATPAQEPPEKTEQATPPAAEEFMVTVKEVTGTVEIQPAGKDAWVPAVVGMRFGEGAKVCTGFQSKVWLEFGDSSVVLLKDLTQMTIDKLFKDANAVEAKMSMEVGRAKIFVKKQEIRIDFRVSTPRLTAAVKGTLLGVESSPDFGDTISGYTGDTALVNELLEELNVGGGDTTNDGLLSPLDGIVLDDILGLSPDGTASYESQGELAAALEQEVGLTAGDPGTGLGQPALDNNLAAEADLPPYSGSQFLSELDVLAGLDNGYYSSLSSFLLNGGDSYAMSNALDNISSFQETYGAWSAQDIWMRNLVASSQYGPALMEEHGSGDVEP